MSGYGISQADMEASRLVFVSVKDSKSRRKVAVPVPDGTSWEDFCRQVQTKLKLLGVDSIYLAASGERVLRTDDLQDIDELYVVETKPAPVVSAAAIASGGNGSAGPAAARSQGGAAAPTSQPVSSPAQQPYGMPSESPQGQHYRVGAADTELQLPGNADGGKGEPAQQQHHRVGVADAEIQPLSIEDEGDADAKYIKRNTALRRSLKRVFPTFFRPSLPVTTRDAKEGGTTSGVSRRRRRGRSFLHPRNLIATFALMTCFGTVLYLYSRMAAHLP